jgi:hypothetical protein
VRRTLLPIVCAVAALAAALAGGCARAHAAPSLADPTEFLARYGLTPTLVPYAEVEAIEDDGPGLLSFSVITGQFVPPGGQCALDLGDTPSEDCPGGGTFVPEGVQVVKGGGPAARVFRAAHEWLHSVSYPHAFAPIGCAPQSAEDLDLYGADDHAVIPQACNQGFVTKYEEALVNLAATYLFADYWRWITGRPISRGTLAYYRGGADTDESYLSGQWRWQRAAVAACRCARWSRGAREWVLAQLLTDLPTRVQTLRGF